MSKLNLELDDAINKADLDKVKQLLEKGADIEYCDPFGNTPLLNAAWVASEELATYLLSIGANINHINNEGQTALELIKSIGHNDYGHDKVIEVLEANGN